MPRSNNPQDLIDALEQRYNELVYGYDEEIAASTNIEEANSRVFTVVVGDVEEYEIEAQCAEDARQYVIDNYLSPADLEELEYDPNYVWVIED